MIGVAVDISIVIPVYRSAGTLPVLVEELLRVLAPLGRPFEIILVEDGSPDDAWQVLCRLQAEHPDRLTVIQLMRNYGQHNALMCGFRHARGRYIVTMDDDLQHPPEEIPRLLEAIETKNLDLVYATYEVKRHRRWRNLGSSLIHAFFRWVFHWDLSSSSFRIIRRELVESILPYAFNYTYVDGLLAWNTQRVGHVLTQHQPRPQGRSSYSFRKLVSLALDVFTNFSILPLRVTTLCGFLAASSGFLLGVYYLVSYFLTDDPVAGYTSTIIIVLILGGVQLLSLGIIGEYLGRVHLNINRKPQYVERHVRAETSARRESPGEIRDGPAQSS